MHQLEFCINAYQRSKVIKIVGQYQSGFSTLERPDANGALSDRLTARWEDLSCGVGVKRFVVHTKDCSMDDKYYYFFRFIRKNGRLTGMADGTNILISKTTVRVEKEGARSGPP